MIRSLTRAALNIWQSAKPTKFYVTENNYADYPRSYS